jgi:hypothetical protein
MIIGMGILRVSLIERIGVSIFGRFFQASAFGQEVEKQV